IDPKIAASALNATQTPASFPNAHTGPLREPIGAAQSPTRFVPQLSSGTTHNRITLRGKRVESSGVDERSREPQGQADEPDRERLRFFLRDEASEPAPAEERRSESGHGRGGQGRDLCHER